MKKVQAIFIGISITLFTITYIVLFFINNNGTNIPIAIHIYDESSKSYVSQSQIPNGKYMLNKDKSSCESGGVIQNYNSLTGSVTHSLSAGDKCILFFDPLPEAAISLYIMETVYNSTENQNAITAQTAGLYKHDSTLANGANDNSYRYAGADASVNNYVCFQGDDCSNENNLYRVISVDPSTNQTKVIKATSLGSMKWNDVYKTDAYVPELGYTASGTSQDTAMGLTSGTVYYNIWAIEKADGSYYTSTLNQYLNGEYLASMEAKTDKIEKTAWSVGGVDNNTYSSQPVKAFMDKELDNLITYEAKIGLMYGSEYGYAALPEVWTTELYNYEPSKGKDWLLTEGSPWTISHRSDLPDRAFFGSNSGYLSSSPVDVIVAVRPAFYLSPPYNNNKSWGGCRH